jgi:hypothetical protein
MLETCIRIKVSEGLCRLVDLLGRVQSFVAPAWLVLQSLQAYVWHSAHGTQHCLQAESKPSQIPGYGCQDFTALRVAQRMCIIMMAVLHDYLHQAPTRLSLTTSPPPLHHTLV